MITTRKNRMIIKIGFFIVICFIIMDLFFNISICDGFLYRSVLIDVIIMARQFS